ncbi:hypothetical protein G195_000919 [Phytophthora kernoviae 00238/432]|uniref:Thiamine pyrophosphate enzyme TPP-binding domain-containing protein n=1 Tax=Phytophthora kernoviae 00238/432 TaxID=1284355 RepID=A0A8J4T0Z5_9STRA|nr:hypothetical protein G195_000919 [Phytophthora kernoviae 00238/432]
MVDYGLEFIPGRHESSSGFAASGYALQTGKLGVAFATSGPGGTNLLTAAAHAKANNLPVLFITGHQSIQELGLPQCQDSSSYLADLAEMFRPATLFSKLVELKKPGSFVFDAYFACMGNAIGMAIGAKTAAPEETIVCITGDGCFMMLGTEINTAVCNNLPVIFIVVNNKQLDMALKGMEKTTGRIDGTLYEVPLDAAKFAESLGAVAYRAETQDEFASALQAAQQLNQDTIAPINTKEYELNIDCKKLNVTAPEIVPLLEGCLQMFKKDEYKKVVLTLENNAILKMQLSRLGRSVGLDNLEIISTVTT